MASASSIRMLRTPLPGPEDHESFLIKLTLMATVFQFLLRYSWLSKRSTLAMVGYRGFDEFFPALFQKSSPFFSAQNDCNPHSFIFLTGNTFQACVQSRESLVFILGDMVFGCRWDGLRVISPTVWARSNPKCFAHPCWSL